ncbi:MAG: arginine--tRNA ligase [Oscillospiraceae bacterium]|nr:arginine--tRNA ligase [Oscillospiraceae bacterium]
MDTNQTVCKDLIYRAMEDARERIIAAFGRAMDSGALPVAVLPDFTVEIPADPSNGDIAANAAMACARVMRKKPLDIAEAVVDELSLEGSFFVRAAAKAPGFINLFFRREWFSRVVSTVLELGDMYGHTNYGNGEKVMVEFVSANPTGPMHMGNARGGALGDTLAGALDAAGYDVTREFFVNDAGNQLEKFGYSLEARYMQHFLGEDAVQFPEDGYQGEDIKDYAVQCAGRFGEELLGMDSEDRRKALLGYCLPRNIQRMEDDLLKYRVNYQIWFYESILHDKGTIAKVISILKEKGLTCEKDGAVWFEATKLGGEKDEVLVRRNGLYTYFAVDIAYHYNKFVERGFSTVINLWGADHHGQVARLKNAVSALGVENTNFELLIFQFVNMVKDGLPYRMSKRTGRAITLADLLDEIPVDAARFFFIRQGMGAPIDFDLDLAVSQTPENPVYYVQYAHARICSIIKKLKEDGVEIRTASAQEPGLLCTAEETALIRLLAQYPGEIIKAAVRRDPSRLAHFLTELAGQFHKFYTACHVRCGDEKLMQARIALCLAAKTVFYNLLTLLKISAPESM